MSTDAELLARCGGRCELCAAEAPLSSYALPASSGRDDAQIMVCANCAQQIDAETPDAEHWRCLRDSIWSPMPAVQVMAWRILKKLEAEAFAQDILAMVYFDEEMQRWAEAANESASETIVHKDCHGNVLSAGDTVTLIKDLDVKGASFTAKRGTAVRGITLTDNPEHIEGRINGQTIVILCCYVKRS
ncbi:PhnA domain-containing protein [Permianibacter aggregans]|uniref:Protein PhnA n=1 Tax=Permianibacter aggregans TaxID=1510150 RepID=A0A4R6URZ5_9GAMM|nr:alkylphosphonate utilization protein [Permianibacter aggregans]QGX39461.1 PhnA domain protein [Permianibacter aggregans]TDQ49802.1 protein PhnA [Permianibacter aggregans]